MSSNLSASVKTHILHFEKTEGREPVYLTSQKAAGVNNFIFDKNKPSHFVLTDDDGNYVETLKRAQIKSVSARESNAEVGLMRWVCGYGAKHLMHQWPADTCGCVKLYGPENKFAAWIARSFDKVRYASDITDGMRNEYLRLSSLAA